MGGGSTGLRSARLSSTLPMFDSGSQRTFFFAAGHARPFGLLANSQLEVTAIVGQHGQWDPWTAE